MKACVVYPNQSLSCQLTIRLAHREIFTKIISVLENISHAQINSEWNKAYMQPKKRPPRSPKANPHKTPRTPHLATNPPDRAMIYGWQAVCEALRNHNRSFHRLLATEPAAARIAPLAHARHLPITLEKNSTFEEILGSGIVHQGLLLEADPLPTIDIKKLSLNQPIIVLDQVTDPRNVGAILRSAAAFCVAAVVSQERHAPKATGALAKAAAGALEYVPYLQVPNIVQTLTSFKRQGRWIIGLDDQGDTLIEQVTGYTPLVFVLGSEGSGLRKLTKKHCDFLTRFHLDGKIKTLNVSNATAIALYAAQRQTSSKTNLKKNL